MKNEEKRYRARVGFSCPADPQALKDARSGASEYPTMTVKAGEAVTPYAPDILRSWLANGLIEEVST